MRHATPSSGMITQASHHKLTISELRKTYGPVTAVARVSLDVGEGEFVTLLGPSGSGKTTLLMMVAGLTWPDSGEVSIDGRLCTYLPSHKRDIGMVFQNYALFPHLTVHENIAFPLRMRRMSDQDISRRVRQALETVRLPDVGERETSALSGGQQQRIALARCIVYQPSIILMDEPLGALDKKLREEMQLEIKHLHEQLGITVLYVTHDQEEAMVMSDKICLFNEGSIEQVGSPEEMYFAPRSKFAASFLGESNILNASVKATARQSRHPGLPGERDGAGAPAFRRPCGPGRRLHGASRVHRDRRRAGERPERDRGRGARPHSHRRGHQVLRRGRGRGHGVRQQPDHAFGPGPPPGRPGAARLVGP